MTVVDSSIFLKEKEKEKHQKKIFFLPRYDNDEMIIDNKTHFYKDAFFFLNYFASKFAKYFAKCCNLVI